MINPFQTLALTNPIFSIFDIGKEAINSSNPKQKSSNCDTWLSFLTNFSDCKDDISSDIKNIFFSIVLGIIDIILWLFIIWKTLNISGVIAMAGEA